MTAVNSKYWEGSDLIKTWQDANVQLACEATDYEKLTLWERWSEEAKSLRINSLGTTKIGLRWIHGSNVLIKPIPGLLFSTYISLSVDIVEDKAVLFWSPTSMYVDYRLAEAWLLDTFPEARHITPDNFLNYFPIR